jgi:DNA invertase Pin-like site-specific DNA recombinase
MLYWARDAATPLPSPILPTARDLLNTLAAIAGKDAGFRSLGDTWADTTTPHGRLMLTQHGLVAAWRDAKKITRSISGGRLSARRRKS